MNYLIALVLLLLTGCSSVDSKITGERNEYQNMEVLGIWYFHMGLNGYIKLNLRGDHTFDVAVIPCSENSEEIKPGGKWILLGTKFTLSWEDGSDKSQELLSVSLSEMKLSSEVGYEHYFRKPVGCSNS